MQFRAAAFPQVRRGRPPHRPPPSDRGWPLDTSRNRCLWHAGGTAGENGDACAWQRRLPAQPRGEARPRWSTASWARARRAPGSRTPGP